MPARPPTSSARRHNVLKLDRCLSPVLAAIIATVYGLPPAQAQILCRQVFREDPAPYYDIAEDRALTKSLREFDDYDGLSAKDLQYLVESVYKNEEGPKFKVSDYWKKNALERTAALLNREAGEKVTHQGLVRFFKDQGILLDESTWLTIFKNIYRSPLSQMASGVVGSTAILRGRLPLLLPNSVFKIKSDDMTILLLRGLDSKEGREIVAKYKIKQEAQRGYTLFSRYYERIALTVAFVILWNNADDFFEKHPDSPLRALWNKILAELHYNQDSAK